VRVACCNVDFVPPSESYEASARDVLEVVEVCCEEQDCDDEDEDVVFCEDQAEEVDEKACCER